MGVLFLSCIITFLGVSALHCAVRANAVVNVERLLERGAIPNSVQVGVCLVPFLPPQRHEVNSNKQQAVLDHVGSCWMMFCNG